MSQENMRRTAAQREQLLQERVAKEAQKQGKRECTLNESYRLQEALRNNFVESARLKGARAPLPSPTQRFQDADTAVYVSCAQQAPGSAS